MLNLWVGLCRGAAGLPTAVRALGYRDKWIEFRFPNSERQQVHPELIIASEQTRHAVLFEWKSGENTDIEQLTRYSKVTAADLQTKVLLSRESTTAFDITVVGKQDHAVRLRIGPAQFGFPLLLAHEGGLTRDQGLFSAPAFNDVFAPTLAIDLSRIPTRFIPLDGDSPVWEVAEVIFPTILKAIADGDPRITVEHICSATCKGWSILAKPGKDVFKAKVHEVCRRIAERPLRAYVRWTRESLEVLDNPFELAPSARTAALRKLREAQRQFIGELQSGQMTLALG